MGSNYIITSTGSFVAEDELYHHGIKGQKWGIRRYQNPDGSLTAAGKKRHNSDKVNKMSNEELRQKVNRMNNEQRYIDLTESSSSSVSKVADDVERASKTGGDINKVYKSIKGDKNPYAKMANQGIDATAKAARLTKKVDNVVQNKKAEKAALKKLEKMSDKELAQTVERMDLERQYSRLKDSSIKIGKVRVNDTLDIVGDIVSIGASAVAVAVGIQKLIQMRKGG